MVEIYVADVLYFIMVLEYAKTAVITHETLKKIMRITEKLLS